MIYVESKDPEIEALRPLRFYNNKQLSKLLPSVKDSLCTLPVKLVSWAYHGRNYTKDETIVSPHLRWQPCGEGRQQVKLVWVREHTRKYNTSIQGEIK